METPEQDPASEGRATTSRATTVSRRALVFSFLAFLSLGLPDGSLGVAWPGMRASLGVNLGSLGVLLGAFTTGTLVSSTFAGRLIEKLGVGRLLAVSGLFVTASAWGLALVSAWPGALVCGLVGGLGAGAVDAGVNAHAALRFSPRAITWLHATWGFGAMTGPLVLTFTLAAGFGWRGGYAVVGALLALLSLAFARNVHLFDAGAPVLVRHAPGARDPAPRGAPVALGVLLFFAYSGVEATCGQWAYTWLTEGHGLEAKRAGLVVSGYWALLAAGRVLFGALTVRFPPRALLRAGAIGVLLGGFGIGRGGPLVGALSLMATGLFLAPIFPLAMAETPYRTGAQVSGRVVGWQVAASTLGGAFWPALGGALAARQGVPVLGAYVLGLSLLLLIVNEGLLRGGRPG